MGLTRDVSEFVAGMAYERIPAQAIPIVKNAFIDTIAVAVAGSEEDCSRIVKEVAREEQAAQIASVWGAGWKTTAIHAALVNGTMSHALDYDDVNSRATLGHPSTAIVPAVVAVAEEVGASGKDMILAYFTGFEVMAYIGKVMSFRHYSRGFHGTATMGVLACTAAAGKLYGLSAEQMGHAFAIAVSHAAGVHRNYGTMTKPLHPGKAARDGIMAAKLAKKGFTGGADIFEAPKGLLEVYGEGRPMTSEKIGDTVELLNTGLSVKKYPSCYCTHRSIDAIQELSVKHGITADQVARIHVKVPPGVLMPLIYSRPQKGLEGKFSMEYTVAAMLVDGKVNFASFTDEMVQRPEIQALIQKITKEEDPSIEVKAGGVEEGHVDVTVTLHDGTAYTHRIHNPKGSAEWPLTAEELKDKFMDCMQGNIETDRANRLYGFLAALEQAESARSLSGLL
mgnify:CR=1 FL=1